ncbi:MAG TPA: hypothetical protein DEA08_38855, partial [Planctomycetes bacterium]|nr:hypothetical protein [Planctomycetota bacterium]
MKLPLALLSSLASLVLTGCPSPQPEPQPAPRPQAGPAKPGPAPLTREGGTLRFDLPASDPA